MPRIEREGGQQPACAHHLSYEHQWAPMALPLCRLGGSRTDATSGLPSQPIFMEKLNYSFVRRVEWLLEFRIRISQQQVQER
jgi:hypothetical protein